MGNSDPGPPVKECESLISYCHCLNNKSAQRTKVTFSKEKSRTCIYLLSYLEDLWIQVVVCQRKDCLEGVQLKLYSLRNFRKLVYCRFSLSWKLPYWLVLELNKLLYLKNPLKWIKVCIIRCCIMQSYRLIYKIYVCYKIIKCNQTYFYTSTILLSN